MTRIFTRYVFRQAFSALALILASLSGIVWIALALRQLNVVTSQGQDAVTLLAMTTLALPNLMALIAPFALLIAVMHTLNRLSGDSELIIMTAAGANVWVVAKPLITLAIIVSIAVALVNHYVMPWSLRVLRAYVVEVRTDLLTQVIQPGRFSSPERGLTFHIRDRDPNGDLRGLIMHDTRKTEEQSSYLAERGQIVKQDKEAFLVMTDGHVLRGASANEPVRIITFDRYAFDLDAFEQKTGAVQDLKPRERYFHELVNPEPTSQSFRRHPGQFTSELHERFVSPLYPLAFVMIALAAAGRARSTRQRRSDYVILGLVAAAGSRLAGLAVNNLVSGDTTLVPILYAIPLTAIFVSVGIMLAGGRQSTGPTIVERLGDVIEAAQKAVVAAIARPRRAGA
ncbi:MAG: LPS export ABC transporter permease LptF [Hyphomicrobium sp.]|nr:LPS export ABC transporter permease LptF [Hyphomicrobium sp.]